jgi:hypothetical protein
VVHKGKQFLLHYKNIKIKIRSTDQIKSRGRIHALHVKARYFLLHI